MGKLYVVHNECIIDPKTGDMPYKIGITKNTIKERFSNFKMPSEFVCDVAYEFDDELYKKLEKRIHGLLNLQRLNGEWFICDDKILDNIEKLCKDFNGKLVVDEIEKEILDETEERDDDDDIFLLVQKKVETMVSTLTKKYNIEFYEKNSDKLNIVRIENNLGARLECNIYHPYNRRVDLEFICRNTHELPEIKNFMRELNGSSINGHRFKTSAGSYKIYHIFDYDNPTLFDTFLELLNFISNKMKSSKIFNK
jgi:hypothetical protein